VEWASDISSDTIGLIEASTILSALLIIPGLIYRFSVKSTAIIWSPLLWAVRSVSTAFGQIASSDACQRAANRNVVFRWPPEPSQSLVHPGRPQGFRVLGGFSSNGSPNLCHLKSLSAVKRLMSEGGLIGRLSLWRGSWMVALVSP